MNPALFKLLWLSTKAAFRRALRGVRTVRGALLVLFTLGFLALMLVPQVITAITMSGRPEMARIAETSELFAPFGLLLIALLLVFTAAGERAIYFTPAEVDLLFSAPFARRELLLYKLEKGTLGLVATSLFMSLMMLNNFRSWLSGFVGILLSLAMLRLLAMTTAMAGQIVAESLYNRARRLLLGVVLLLLLMGLAQVARRVQGGGIAELVASVRDSGTLQVLVAPFRVFTRTIFAGAWFPDLAGWAAASLAINLGLLTVILKMDANYLESAAAISQRLYEQLRRIKQGGGLAMPASSRGLRIHLPHPPWLGGAGPVAWRQLLLAIRTSRHVFFATMGLAVVFFTVLVAADPGPDSAGLASGMGIGMTAYLTFLFAMQLPWAFRGDLDHMDVLKTLPLHPMVLAVGELAGGVLLLTLIQVVILALFTAAAPASIPAMLAAAAFALPFNGMILGLNNLLFLIYPVRLMTGTAFDFQTFGRSLLFFSLLFLLLIPLFGIPAGIGGLACLLIGFSWPVFALTAWLVLVAELLPVVILVAWAFQRFDPSTQMPA
ncbi:MAG TPA: putative ABC exporter domain-containing protein [Isosphaeraceae bacterium]|nr:putative ABC exporter domain-containing protein [Isosphaeraceae bacterium]